MTLKKAPLFAIFFPQAYFHGPHKAATLPTKELPKMLSHPFVLERADNYLSVNQ